MTRVELTLIQAQREETQGGERLRSRAKLKAAAAKTKALEQQLLDLGATLEEREGRLAAMGQVALRMEEVLGENESLRLALRGGEEAGPRPTP